MRPGVRLATRTAPARLPDDPRRRERQLVRMAMAATSVGLAREMQDLDGSEWFRRSAAAYRESFTGDNWGASLGL